MSRHASASSGSLPRGALALLGGLVLACGEARDPAPPRPDVLLVVVDTLRHDHTTVYGYAPPTTPEFARVAERGVVFETAYAPMATTCPSHATLFTGRHVGAHGVTRNGYVLGEQATTLAERLADAGYDTAGFVSSFPVSRSFGLAQGFAHFDDDFAAEDGAPEQWKGTELPTGRAFERAPEATVDAALAWLRDRDDDAPLFAWVHVFDPHAPRSPEHPEVSRFPPRGDDDVSRQVTLYDAELRGVDTQLGRLVDAFTARAGERGALLVLTADHGEGLGDHGWLGHDRSVHDSELRVPLVFAWEGVLPAGRRVTQPAHLVDVLPTLASALGLALDDPAAAGVDLLPYARGERAPDPERALLLASPARHAHESAAPGTAHGPGYGLRVGRWKYYELPELGRYELYDLEQDPREQRNVLALHGALARELSARLRALVVARSVPEAGVAPGEVDDAQLEGLRALGYLGGDAPASGSVAPTAESGASGGDGEAPGGDDG